MCDFSLAIDLYTKFINKNGNKSMYYYINVVVDLSPHESSLIEKTSRPPNEKSKPSSSSSNLIVVEKNDTMFDEKLYRCTKDFIGNINHEMCLRRKKVPVE
jgi:hypothetical protein